MVMPFLSCDWLIVYGEAAVAKIFRSCHQRTYLGCTSASGNDHFLPWLLNAGIFDLLYAEWQQAAECKKTEIWEFDRSIQRQHICPSDKENACL